MYRASQLQQSAHEHDQQPYVGIQNAAALPFELEGEIKQTGEPVTFLQTCDWPGHSPSLVGVDANGEVLIAAFNEVRIRDRRVVPNEKLAGGGKQRSVSQR